MRVVSGRWRGLRLAEFDGRDIRPTADRVKESLFDILSARISGAVVSDLFCGSGSLGIECLSRGAKYVCFNDISEQSLAVLRKNLAKLKDVEGYKITRSDFAFCLNSCGDMFDLIFIDPPYRSDCGAEALKIIAEKKLLKEGGVAVYERDVSFVGEIEGLIKYDERKYGKTYLTFFEREE